jgi:regulator of protease activity HflC (stomatin/prohibitin superfamily)
MTAPTPGTMIRIQEKHAFRVTGFAVFLVEVAVAAVAMWQFAAYDATGATASIVVGVAAAFVAAIVAPGFFTVQPNEARVVVFFGTYTGSVREAGFWWTNPLTTKRRVSLRVRNFNSDRLKVNDADGNPVEIAAVVVWRVVESAKAVFDVDDYEQFVDIQAETAIRNLATRYPYDASGQDRQSLRENPDELAAALKTELDARLEVAGVDVLEARLTHLAYAPEIAQAMLRRQQAQAVVAARKLIVEAAVGMVEEALDGLATRGVVELDQDKRAAMANNLMVALTSEQASTPVINTGTLYAG